MDWLKPAMALTAITSGILAATFLYVWLHFSRRGHVLMWSLAWTVAIPHILLQWLLLDDPASYRTWAASQVCLVVNALLMTGGCYHFVHGRIPLRGLSLLALPLLVWSAVAPRLTEDFAHIVFPSSALLGVSYLWTATRFVHLRRERHTQGARLVAILFGLAGLHELDYPLLGSHPWGAPIGYGLAATLAFSIALCLLIMILEEGRAEAERERAKVRAVLDNLPVGVLLTSPAGQVTLANGLARELLHDDAESITGTARGPRAVALVAPDSSPVPVEELPLRQALKRGERVEARELLLQGPEGLRRSLLVNAGPVRDERHQLLGAVTVLQDIDALKRMQEEVARADRLTGLGTLAAGVAHDFNNALTMILGHAELARDASQAPSVRHQLDIICQVASDSAAMVRRIQDVARTRSSRDDTVFDLSEVAREVVDIARPRWKDSAEVLGLRYLVRVSMEPGLTMRGKPAELREALLNLVFNALDAMPKGGSLELSGRRLGSRLVLSVTDTGHGMSEAVRSRVFDPFFTTKGSRGTGLGLAIVFGIVQRHDGTIEVSSKPGAGTTFRLQFPAAAATLDPSRPRTDHDSARSLRLLAVDDQALVRGLMEAVLRKAGHRVCSVGTAQEALALIAREPFDLVITDLGMPGMNGWDLARELRARRPDLRIVLATGWGESISDEEMHAAGVSQVLSKPFTPAQLLECVHQVARSGAVEADYAAL